MYCKCPQQFLRFWNVHAWPLEKGIGNLGGGGVCFCMICVLRKLRVLFPCFLKIGRNFWLEFIQLRLYLFKTTWIIHIFFWLYRHFWELILNSLKLPSLLICFLSVSCSLMMCRRVLTLLFYFIVRIFLFCVCLYMYVCIYILNDRYIMSILLSVIKLSYAYIEWC